MKIVILGAGASGLGVAWRLVELGHKDILVIEKDTQVGGLSGSFRLGKSLVDYGPHRFSPEYPDLVEKVRDLLGDEFKEQSNEHAVHFHGRFYRYPPKIIDFLNVSTFLAASQAVASFVVQRIVANLRAIGILKLQPATFPGIITARFGGYLYREVVQPMCTKVWGNPGKLDPEFANLRFSVPTITQWAKKAIGVRDAFNDKVFYYPTGGFQRIWEKIVEKLDASGVKVICSAQVNAINQTGQKVTSVAYLHEGQQHEVTADYLVSTIPTQHLVRLIKPSPVRADEVLSMNFPNRGMLLCYFLLKKERALPARVVIFPEGKFVFNRLSEQNQFSREMVPAGHSAILADILVEPGSELWGADDKSIIARVQNQLREIGLLVPADVAETAMVRVPIAYPLPTKERENEQTRFNEIFSMLDNVLSTGRFASSDYNNSHTALRKGLMAAESIDRKQSLAEWYKRAEEIRKTAIRD